MALKILILDVELKPITAHVWKIWDESVGLSQIESDWSVLSWAAKWLDKDKIYYSDQRKNKDLSNDKQVLLPLWDLMDQADILIGHNAKKFDLKKINTRFIKHGMMPTVGVQVIDTLIMAKSQFAFTSNKLAYIAEFLGVGLKGEHKEFPGFDLWKECMRGNQRAWRELEAYNKQDIIVTEAVYKKLRPFCKTVNTQLWLQSDDKVFCECGSARLIGNGERVTLTGRYKRLRCADCGKGYTSKPNLVSKEVRKKFLTKD